MYTTQYNYFHDRPINEFDTKFYKISLNERKLIQVKSYKTLCFEIFYKNIIPFCLKIFHVSTFRVTFSTSIQTFKMKKGDNFSTLRITGTSEMLLA